MTAGGPDRDRLEELEEQLKAWEANEVEAFIKRQPERQEQFKTYGETPVKRD